MKTDFNIKPLNRRSETRSYFAAVHSCEEGDDDGAKGDVDQVAVIVVAEMPGHSDSPVQFMLLLLVVHGSTSEVTERLKQPLAPFCLT